MKNKNFKGEYFQIEKKQIVNRKKNLKKSKKSKYMNIYEIINNKFHQT
jgi:hypothetical protein